MNNTKRVGLLFLMSITVVVAYMMFSLPAYEYRQLLAADSLDFLGHLSNSSRPTEVDSDTPASVLLLPYQARTARATSMNQQKSATASFKLIPSTRFLSSPSVSRTGIPRIIHQTWKDQGTIPTIYRTWMSTWFTHLAYDDWEYWFWTHADMRRFVRQVFPQHLSMYDSYSEDLYRADVFRYMLLYKYGGIYADLDVECLKSINPLIDEFECGVADEPLEHVHFTWGENPPLLSNAIMMCRPSHDFFSLLISSLEARFTDCKNDAFYCTGPMFLTDVYMKNRNNGEGSGKLTILKHDYFQPTPDLQLSEYSLHSNIMPNII